MTVCHCTIYWHFDKITSTVSYVKQNCLQNLSFLVVWETLDYLEIADVTQWIRYLIDYYFQIYISCLHLWCTCLIFI